MLVRINDRGPFAKGRIIDLSEAGARVLGMIQTGTAQVALYVMKLPQGGEGLPGSATAGSAGSQSINNIKNPSQEPVQRRYKVQVASFAEEQNALREKKRLAEQGLQAEIEKALVNGKEVFRIILYTTEQDLSAVLKKLAELGIQKPLVISL